MDNQNYTCEICGGNHPTEAHASGDLEFPSVETLDSMDFDSLQALFDKNDRALLEQIKSRPVPYFGLHGAAKSGLDKHKSFAHEGAVKYDIATFYDKNADRQVLLNSLYACAEVASHYAFLDLDRLNFKISDNDAWGIEVVNLEDEQDNYSRIEDKKRFKPKFPAQEQGDVVTARGIITLNPENFSRIIKILTNTDLRHYAEIVDSSLKAFEKEYESDPKSEAAKTLYGKFKYNQALLNQAIIEQCLKAFEE